MAALPRMALEVPRDGHGGLLDRLVTGCLMVLLAVFALHLAVGYLQEIWPWLLAAAAFAGLMTIATFWWRRNRNRW